MTVYAYVEQSVLRAYRMFIGLIHGICLNTKYTCRLNDNTMKRPLCKWAYIRCLHGPGDFGRNRCDLYPAYYYPPYICRRLERSLRAEIEFRENGHVPGYFKL